MPNPLRAALHHQSLQLRLKRARSPLALQPVQRTLLPESRGERQAQPDTQVRREAVRQCRIESRGDQPRAQILVKRRPLL